MPKMPATFDTQEEQSGLPLAEEMRMLALAC